MNLTKSYPFDSMSVGDSFVVNQRYQHARVAASEYARRHNVVFTCRMQEDRSMLVIRVAHDQERVDQRGRNGRRRIPANSDPTQLQFMQWLATFAVGQSYTMPALYSHLFLAMAAWCELYSIRASCNVTSVMIGGTLLIKRS
jgi:hypothetical protein